MSHKLHIEECTRCKCCITRKNIVNSKGNIHNGIAIFGFNPTSTENTKGEIFSSKYHNIIKEILNYYDIDIKDIYLSNLSKCRVPSNISTEEKNILIHNCIKYYANFESFGSSEKPKVILFLGGNTFKTVLGYIPNRVSRLYKDCIKRDNYNIYVTDDLIRANKNTDIYNRFCHTVELFAKHAFKRINGYDTNKEMISKIK